MQFAQVVTSSQDKSLNATCLSFKCNKPISYSATLNISGARFNAVTSSGSHGTSSNTNCPTISSAPPLSISKQITGVSPVSITKSGPDPQTFPDGSQCFSLGTDASLILSVQCYNGCPQLQVTGVKSTPDGKDIIQSQCSVQSNKVASLPAMSTPNSAKLFCNQSSPKRKGSYNYQCVGTPLF
jgi:hypothetical protein